MHNTLAVGAIMALQEMGRKVPEDCSIVGLPASDESELIIPPLTGIEWSMQDIGYQAAKMLIRELNGAKPKPEQILIPPKLTLRQAQRQRLISSLRLLHTRTAVEWAETKHLFWNPTIGIVMFQFISR